MYVRRRLSLKPPDGAALPFFQPRFVEAVKMMFYMKLIKAGTENERMSSLFVILEYLVTAYKRRNGF